ncbi:M20 family metallopeptidase [Corynebacterium sp. sy039]|uniref:M20 metallopeptidase family protein n=1 Tax=Corynebacterium sp. sy039 TaxID=2599641 RepID=UPI0011B6782D|nr:M20 family metallopeptidase [Corynebacterium sp. sy039]QDZ42874.1 amidohydrolase [Corynebacterium sp. sy039]
MMARDLDSFADKFYELLSAEIGMAQELRKRLHQNPRVSGEESETTQEIIAYTGCEFSTIATTGAYTRIGKKTGPAVAIRGELDALAITEKTGVTWAATNGAMHACGHDVHLAALGAVIRAARQIDLPVALVPILQPREETYPSGALDIKKSGIFEQQNIQYAIGAHVHPSLPCGSVATGAGVVNAAAAEVHFSISGQGGHGAYPHKAKDIVAPTAQIALAIPEVVRRTLDPMNPALVSVGQMIVDSGGANVLPETGKITATMRTTRKNDAETLVQALSELAQGIASAYGVVAKLEYRQGEPVLHNAEELCKEMDVFLRQAGLELAPPMRSLGADDFSFFSAAVPSVMAFVGTGSEHNMHIHLHDARFLPDEDAVRRVALTMASGYLGAARKILAP